MSHPMFRPWLRALLVVLAASPIALSGLTGCGDQLVEFPADGGDGGGGGGSGDDIPPTVTATTPLDAAQNLALAKKPTATFSRPMAASTLTAATFTVVQGGMQVPGAVSYTGLTATFTPAQPLGIGLVYIATITTGAQDPDGMALTRNHVWTFSTGACSLAGVALGSVADFAVLGGSTVTSTGETSIVGDVGVSPGTAVTGFPPGLFVGTMQVGNEAAAAAMADLTTAYNDAAGRTLCAISVAGDLGGRTLTPGLYKSTSSLEITSDHLTLDAQGDEDAVFIFQTASTLTTAADRRVILTGGAKAGNVTWQIGTSVTLGTGSTFAGTLLADQAIAMTTGATLQGRSLARIAVVSLDASVINRPAR